MTNFFSIFNTIFNDAPQPWQLGFQDSAAPGFTGLVTLHNTIGFYLIVISFSVFWVLFSLIYYYSYNKNPIAHKYLTHGTVLELVWTITPALILIAIAFPSFRLLYLMDEVISPTLTIKVVGHQWYWSYEYSDFITDSGESIDFDSLTNEEYENYKNQFINKVWDFIFFLLFCFFILINIKKTNNKKRRKYKILYLGLYNFI